jgi:hypothetical protein
MDPTRAYQISKIYECISCQRPLAAFEKWRQCILRSHLSGWGVIVTTIWQPAQTIECWMECPKLPNAIRVLWKSCTSCSCQNDLVLDHLMSDGVTLSGQSYCALLQDESVCLSWTNQRYLGMVLFGSRTMPQIIAIVMCKDWCNVWARKCWHVLSNLQISPFMVSGC